MLYRFIYSRRSGYKYEAEDISESTRQKEPIHHRELPQATDGKPTTRTVKTLGFLDELEKSFDDPVAHFTQLAHDMTEEKRASIAPVSIRIHPVCVKQ